ncbi:TetR/AcrR family transcriptional regulator [Amycolatopsis pithecellobii]|uniref:TetR family transcriptional regulator n=1 Tax=Amycolatopsis pithecellobii TaxID=664692 RepID=A0A6N7ZBF6_9PSEU|nr:TetR/AcrR family transcriptional regulator [Amycolatopsis pithecellobii]MTD59101.1 TetR family transcriptional regulator [Amycolatopsis pithecellobii]
MTTSRSPRERPAKPALTSEGIVSAAVGIMQAEGLKKVTMRRLAQELDTGPASLYVYFANTDALHAAVLDRMLGKVDLAPVEAQGDWRDRLIQVLSSYTTVLFGHASLARSALVSRPGGPHYLEIVEAVLALLHEGGVPQAQAAWGVDILLALGTATAAEHARDDDEAPEVDWSTYVQVIHAASPNHPYIGAIGTDLLSGTPEERLQWAFRVLINGIAFTPRS